MDRWMDGRMDEVILNMAHHVPQTCSYSYCNDSIHSALVCEIYVSKQFQDFGVEWRPVFLPIVIKAWLWHMLKGNGCHFVATFNGNKS